MITAQVSAGPALRESRLLEDKVAIITGASRGIGAAAAHGFAAAGAAVVPATAVWLCSDQASFITGATIPTDGGKLAGSAAL